MVSPSKENRFMSKGIMGAKISFSHVSTEINKVSMKSVLPSGSKTTKRNLMTRLSDSNAVSHHHKSSV